MRVTNASSVSRLFKRAAWTAAPGRFSIAETKRPATTILVYELEQETRRIICKRCRQKIAVGRMFSCGRREKSILQRLKTRSSETIRTSRSFSKKAFLKEHAIILFSLHLFLGCTASSHQPLSCNFLASGTNQRERER